jgi:hypothetical protein
VSKWTKNGAFQYKNFYPMKLQIKIWEFKVKSSRVGFNVIMGQNKRGSVGAVYFRLNEMETTEILAQETAMHKVISEQHRYLHSMGNYNV